MQLTKIGNGTLTLSAANGYTGETTIEAGTLAVAATGSIAGAPANTSATPTVSTGQYGGALTLAGNPDGTGGSIGTVAAPLTARMTMAVEKFGKVG